jgi:hypothetical protein
MSPFHQALLFPPNTKKAVSDAWNSYHAVPIPKEDQHYTTFITPLGQYRYISLPQGCIAARDGYTDCYDEIMSDIPYKMKCFDDVGTKNMGTDGNINIPAFQKSDVAIPKHAGHDRQHVPGRDHVWSADLILHSGQAGQV